LKSAWRDFANGLVKENPVFRLVLGLCPTLAITTAAENGFWMGLAVIFVLTFSNIFIAALRKIIPDKIRIPCFIVVIAAFVGIVDLFMHAFMPDMYRILGIYIPLIVVNCIIMARAEAFASQNPVLNSAADGLGMGIGFTVAVIIIGAIREILGTGNLVVMGRALFGTKGLGFDPAIVMILPQGGFFTLGLLLIGLNALQQRGQRRRGQKA
jgi:electron transport complex protein RnfE